MLCNSSMIQRLLYVRCKLSSRKRAFFYIIIAFFLIIQLIIDNASFKYIIYFTSILFLYFIIGYILISKEIKNYDTGFSIALYCISSQSLKETSYGEISFMIIPVIIGFSFGVIICKLLNYNNKL